jgi:hypothetical protein
MQHVLLFVQAIAVASKNPKMRKQGTDGRYKHVTLLKSVTVLYCYLRALRFSNVT